MKKSLLKITIACAACWMLASARAQADSQSQPSSDAPAIRSSSTKHLSATGRDGEVSRSVRATQLSGAAVNDASGQRIATLEDTIINPTTGRVEFGLLSLNGAAEATSSVYSGNSKSIPPESSATASSDRPNKLVPVPWSLLRTKSSSSQYSSSSEKPAFTLNNVDENKLKSAPSVQPSDLGQSEWQQRVYAYYGVTPSPSSTGAAESPSGEIKGEGAKKMENTTPARQQPEVP